MAVHWNSILKPPIRRLDNYLGTRELSSKIIASLAMLSLIAFGATQELGRRSTELFAPGLNSFHGEDP